MRYGIMNWWKLPLGDDESVYLFVRIQNTSQEFNTSVKRNSDG
jgi:hypothetical protein